MIRWTMIIPFLFVFTFPILLALVFVTLGLFLLFRWLSIVLADYFNAGDMKVPTFYSTKHDRSEEEFAFEKFVFFMSIVGVVFGGIHCAGWVFTFPSSDEAMLWRVCSAVLTGIAFLLPLLVFLTSVLYKTLNSSDELFSFFVDGFFVHTFYTIILLAYVVSRLLLLVEAFISLRHLTPGMLALVKWTSFIPHI